MVFCFGIRRRNKRRSSSERLMCVEIGWTWPDRDNTADTVRAAIGAKGGGGISMRLGLGSLDSRSVDGVTNDAFNGGESRLVSWVEAPGNSRGSISNVSKSASSC